tara:strand:- start:376 stop:1761 length:1386 start_codon:yes stop_codon:yes gene_type:complete
MLGETKKIHFVGIGGIGMSGIAELLYNLEYIVSGSDLIESDRTKHLSKIGIDIKIGHNKNNVSNVDLVVYSSAVQLDNCELIESKKNNIPIIKRAEMLGELLKVKQNSIAVSGTHGKTSTTSMLGSILNEAKKHPTLVVGGIVHELQSNSILGKGDTIVVEADEYDRTLLSLKPTMSIVTNIEYEHSDCYENLDSLKNTFLSFINSVPFYGINVIYYDDINIQSILNKIKRPYLKYGKSNLCDIRYENTNFKGSKSSFDLIVDNVSRGKIDLQVPGEHNILNSLAAIGVAMELNIDLDIIKKGIKNYKGVKRRFEIKYKTNNNIMIVDDYAHHPTEVDATIKSARAGWKLNKLIVIFQPHLYSRTKIFYKEFANILSKADIVFLTDIFPSREKPVEGVNSNLIFNNMELNKKFLLSKKEITNKVSKVTSDGDMVIVMGAGDIKDVTDLIYKQIEMENTFEG